jgi:transcriptional regulator with XRE-family HTH domain
MNRSRQESRRRALQQLLREARLAAGLRQEDVAHRLGYPQSFVSKYETGERTLDLAELFDICETLGIHLTTIVRQLEAREP